MKWPNTETDFDLLFWALLTTATTDEQKIDARDELVRRLGSLEAVAEAMRERSAIPVPLGILPDWEPSSLGAGSVEQLWKVQTESGSIYQFIRSSTGEWWMEVTRTVPSPFAADILERTAIGRPSPFPPRVGESMLIPLYALGKLRLTTPVVEVTAPTG